MDLEFVAQSLQRLTAQPTLVLLGGSGLLAAGLSILLGVALHALAGRRARTRAVGSAAAEVAREVTPSPRVDVIDEPAPPVPSIDLAAVDARLEEVELHLERLQARIDALVRSKQSRGATRSAPASRTQTAVGSEEERTLREMVARSGS